MLIAHRQYLKSETFRRVAELLDAQGPELELETALASLMFQISRSAAERPPGLPGIRRLRLGRLSVTYYSGARAYWIQFDSDREPAGGRTEYGWAPMRHFWMVNAVYDESDDLFALELLER